MLVSRQYEVQQQMELAERENYFYVLFEAFVKFLHDLQHSNPAKLDRSQQTLSIRRIEFSILFS